MGGIREFATVILQGALQGVAEFLPVSSSGHLAVAGRLLGLGEVPPLFSVLLHMATLCAVVLFFRRRILSLLGTFFRLVTRRPAPTSVVLDDGTRITLTEAEAATREAGNRRYILAVVLSTAVTAVLGLASEKVLGGLPLRAVFVGFLVTAALLVLSAVVSRRRGNAAGEGALAPSWWQALVIGLAQGVGTLPGISRSGSTISGALFAGVGRVQAGEFSFIISIPAILGAFLLEAKDLGGVASTVGGAALVAGCLVAFAVGYASLSLLMRIIRRGRLEWFACYLVPAGILGLLFLS